MTTKKDGIARSKPEVSVDTTLNARGSTYGRFVDVAAVAQSLKRAAREHPGWGRLEADQREALDNVFMKIARILCGDPSYVDNWHDISGYAKLVEDRLNGVVR